MKKTISIKKRLTRFIWILIALVLLICIPFGYKIALEQKHYEQAKESEEMFLEIEQLIKQNDKDIEELRQLFYDRSLNLSKVAAYFIDLNPKVVSNPEEARKMADILNCDELHFFNDKGVIIGGTNEEYFGMDFDSGKQISFFKPMLEDRSLSLCQEVMPNSSQGKYMQYAASWTKDNDYIVQIGMEQIRFLQLEKEKSIEAEIMALPFDIDGYFHIFNVEDGSVVASTSKNFADKNAEDFDGYNDFDLRKIPSFYHDEYSNDKFCIYTKLYDNYLLVRAYASDLLRNSAFDSITRVVIMLSVILLLATLILNRYLKVNLYDKLNQLIDDLKLVLEGKKIEIGLKTNVEELDKIAYYTNRLSDNIESNFNTVCKIVEQHDVPTGVFESNLYHERNFYNQRLLDILGINKNDYDNPRDLDVVLNDKLKVILASPVEGREKIYNYKKGHNNIFLKIDNNTSPQGTLYYITDVTKYLKEISDLSKRNEIDEISKLYNRRGFFNRLDQIPKDELKFAAVAIINVCKLRDIIDQYGQNFADIYLVNVSNRLTTLVQYKRIIARISDDEFVILIYGINDANELSIIDSKINGLNNSIISVGGREVNLELEIGLAYYPLDGDNIRSLLKIADQKMSKE